ncbi:hypothetical protein EYF80_036663 [Liparis tanakae]|uniref:Uncharacterized protein n=1 Tax=Liparis tanakae TaxID=230148 RepID=A0A4Z2GK28_9TELE|nr:hypothetical protein EYF80_036663 [Liparis tanakae]
MNTPRCGEGRPAARLTIASAVQMFPGFQQRGTKRVPLLNSEHVDGIQAGMFYRQQIMATPPKATSAGSPVTIALQQNFSP